MRHRQLQRVGGRAILSALVTFVALGTSAAKLAADEPASAEIKARVAKMLEGQRAADKLLATLAREHGYALEQGQQLRRVPTPFTDARLEYYRAGNVSQAKAEPNGPSAMIFEHHGYKLTHRGSQFGAGYSLEGLLTWALGIRSHMIEGGDILQKPLEGDWVLREGADQQQVLEQLAALLKKELSLKVRIEFREIERPVYVVAGEYKFQPLENGRKQDTIVQDGKIVEMDAIEFFAQWVPNSGAGGGTGTFAEMLDWLGQWVDKPMVSELKAPPKQRLSWHLHTRRPSTEQTRAEDHDPERVLPNITAQTGLTFTLAQRPVKVLFVEQTE